MERLEIKATRRQGTGKGVARKIRAAGGIPAVLYGRGAEAVSLEVEAHGFNRAVAGLESINAIINLSVEGQKSVPVVLRDFQTHVISRKFLHLDFHQIDMSKEIHLEVPLHMVGTPKGVKEQGGVLEHSLRQIEISCLPDNIPPFIEVDVSALQAGENLHVGDLVLPKGVKLLSGVELTVAAVVAPGGGEPKVEETAVAEGEEEAEEKTEEKKEEKK